MKRMLLALAFIASCAHAPDGAPCNQRCDYQFPGEGWRYAIPFFPVTPSYAWNACVDACKNGKTYRRKDAAPDPWQAH